MLEKVNEFRDRREGGDGERREELERALRRISSRGAIVTGLVADQLGLSASDVECLVLLADHGTLSAGDLGEAIGLTTGSITRLIDRLERRGYVRRQPDPLDRRRVMVEPVADRVRAVDVAFQPLREATIALLEGVTEDGMATLDSVLDGYEQTLQAEIARLARTLQGQFAPLAEMASGTESRWASGTIGRLLFRSGTSNARITVDPAMSDLYRVEFDGPPADVQVKETTITITNPQRSFLRPSGPRSISLVLNGSIPWEIACSGGVSNISADLRSIDLRSFSLSGGVSNVSLSLPYSERTVPIRLSGGASHLRLDRPAQVPVRVQLSGGVSHLVVDGQRIGPVGGSLNWTSPNADHLPIGYEIQLSGGASHLTIEGTSRET